MTNRGTCRPLGELFWRADESSQGASRYHGGRTQIYVGVAIAHAALEIAIGRADGSLAFLHQTASQADAGSATRRQWNGASAQKSLPIAVFFGLGLHLGAGRGQIELDPIGDVSAARAHHFGGVMQILETRVHARQQICLLNRHMLSLDFRKRYHRLYLVRPGHVRNYGGKIKFEFDAVFAIRVSAEFSLVLPLRIDMGMRIVNT